jgi:hypothetical protein
MYQWEPEYEKNKDKQHITNTMPGRLERRIKVDEKKAKD